jgi:glycosyltransferase involved in cell wall biosynthesis
LRQDIDFSIITPSLNMLDYLQTCVLSIKDQQQIQMEHIVIDGASTDGTAEWLKGNQHIRSISEKDRGMYDAINKGLHMARGRILAWLNCDEQYLPDTLRWVKRYFDTNTDVDMIFGHALLIRPDGTLIAFRKSYRPRWSYILSSHLYLLTCAMFFRKRIIDDGVFTDPRYRIIGDRDFVLRILKNGYKVKHVDQYLSVYTMTGQNLSNDNNVQQERNTLVGRTPAWAPKFSGLLAVARLTEKFFSGAYFQKMPLEYSVYIDKDAKSRKKFCARKASFRWKNPPPSRT